MTNYNYLHQSKQLLPPCTSSMVKKIETDLNYRLPEEYKEFLLFADGGMLTDNVILFSAGAGIHPAETLRAANNDRQDLPIFLIGRFADEEFGFLRKDTDDSHRPVYLYEHEVGDTKKLADSFEAFCHASVVRQVL